MLSTAVRPSQDCSRPSSPAFASCCHRLASKGAAALRVRRHVQGCWIDEAISAVRASGPRLIRRGEVHWVSCGLWLWLRNAVGVAGTFRPSLLRRFGLRDQDVGLGGKMGGWCWARWGLGLLGKMGSGVGRDGCFRDQEMGGWCPCSGGVGEFEGGSVAMIMDNGRNGREQWNGWTGNGMDGPEWNGTEWIWISRRSSRRAIWIGGGAAQGDPAICC